MKKYTVLLLISSFLILLNGCQSIASNNKQQGKPNVLFIIVDDLRTDLGCFGNATVHSPNIDKLASEGMVFDRAYCQVPVCGASRASLLSGIRPSMNRFRTYSTRQDEDVPGIESLPAHFRNNGYTTASIGKVYHHIDDAMESWSIAPWDSIIKKQTWHDYVLEENISLQNDPEIKSGPAFECANVPDEAYRDGRFAQKAIEDLKHFQQSGDPFFLALGFVKPHLPFNAPKKYWDLYDEATLQLADNPFAPKNAPKQAMHNFGELRNYYGIPKEGPVPDSTARKLIHGYYAATSYTDAMIGKVLHGLDSLGLAENTVVVLLADHGWHLGEHGLWCKHCNFDKVLRVPLIIRTPRGKAARTLSMTELIDLYPTLCELCGLEKPEHLDGKSLVEVLRHPDHQNKTEIYSRYHNGETVINQRFAYTEWYNKQYESMARMLYDHNNDKAENTNISEEQSSQATDDQLGVLLQENRDRLRNYATE